MYVTFWKWLVTQEIISGKNWAMPSAYAGMTWNQWMVVFFIYLFTFGLHWCYWRFALCHRRTLCARHFYRDTINKLKIVSFLDRNNCCFIESNILDILTYRNVWASRQLDGRCSLYTAFKLPSHKCDRAPPVYYWIIYAVQLREESHHHDRYYPTHCVIITMLLKLFIFCLKRGTWQYVEQSQILVGWQEYGWSVIVSIVPYLSMASLSQSQRACGQALARLHTSRFALGPQRNHGNQKFHWPLPSAHFNEAHLSDKLQCRVGQSGRRQPIIPSCAPRAQCLTLYSSQTIIARFQTQNMGVSFLDGFRAPY